MKKNWSNSRWKRKQILTKTHSFQIMKVLGESYSSLKPLETIHENKIYLRLWPRHTILCSKGFWTAISWKLGRYSVERSLHASLLFFRICSFICMAMYNNIVCCRGSFLIRSFVSTEFTTHKKYQFVCKHIKNAS